MIARISIGVALGLALFGAALWSHGGLRADRGCVIDSPLYELVNAPALLLGSAGVHVLAAERVGESPPVGTPPPAGPTFRAARSLEAGAAFWAVAGAAMGALTRVIRRRSIAAAGAAAGAGGGGGAG
jgi:hypothetical protein